MTEDIALGSDVPFSAVSRCSKDGVVGPVTYAAFNSHPAEPGDECCDERARMADPYLNTFCSGAW